MKVYAKVALVIFLFNSLLADGQTTAVSDSLTQLLQSQTDDSAKVLLLDAISRNKSFTDPFDALQYAKQGLALAQQIDFKIGVARNLNRIGSILSQTGNYGKALETFFESIKTSQAINDQEGLAKTYINVGILYGEQKDSRTAIKYYFKSKEIAEKLNMPELVSLAYLNLGTDYGILKKYDSARIYTQKVYDMSLKLKNDHTNILLLNLGDIYHQTKDYPASLAYFRQARELSIKLKKSRILAQVYFEMADVFNELNQRDSSLFYAKKALSKSEEIYHLNYIYKSSKLLSQLYEKQDAREALRYFKIGIAARDSIFNIEKTSQILNLSFKDNLFKQELAYKEKEYKIRQKTELLVAILAVAFTILLVLSLLNRQKNKANALLTVQKQEVQKQKDGLQESLETLKITQNQLIQKEKLATLGELTAGIAHEIQNPLNFVNNFSELSIELTNDLVEEIDKLKVDDKAEIIELLDDITNNQKKINFHGKRASDIVKMMLEHSRFTVGEVEKLTNINKFIKGNAVLAYNTLRIKDKNMTTSFKFVKDTQVPTELMLSQELGRVIINLTNNALYATNQKKLLNIEQNIDYEPQVIVKTIWNKDFNEKNDLLEIKIIDNGIGIEEAKINKIFQPFFTTKPTGEGTGLGLSLSNDIINNQLNGTIEVESVEGQGSTFTVKLPIKKLGSKHNLFVK